MKSLLFLYFVASIAVYPLLVACEEDKDEVEACETDSFGVLKINFAPSNVRHSVIVNANNIVLREKIIERGKTSDTLRLSSGNYPISIASINDAGLSLQSENRQIFVTKCDEISITVNF